MRGNLSSERNSRLSRWDAAQVIPGGLVLRLLDVFVREHQKRTFDTCKNISSSRQTCSHRYCVPAFCPRMTSAQSCSPPLALETPTVLVRNYVPYVWDAFAVSGWAGRSIDTHVTVGARGRLRKSVADGGLFTFND